MHIVTKTLVNIYKKPVPIQHPFKVTEATIGDLHANVIKVIYFLIKNSIIFMEDADFDQLVKLYKTPHDQWSERFLLELFIAVRAFVVIDKKVLVKLLGDETADRYPNLDVTFLKFLAEYRSQGGLIQIHASNHGLEFVTYMEFSLQLGDVSEIPLNAFALYGKHGNGFSASLANMHAALLQQWVSLEKVKDLYETMYRPVLRVMTTSISPTTHETHFFSHAEAGLETIDALSECFGVPIPKPTLTSIIAAIDMNNDVFQKKYAFVNRISYQGCYCMSEMGNPLSAKSAMAHLTWRRPGEHAPISSPAELVYDESSPVESLRPVKWFHGHDATPHQAEHSFTLDCRSGMPPTPATRRVGDEDDGENGEDEALDYIDLVSDHLPQSMLIYQTDTLPKLQALLLGVPEDATLILNNLLDRLWRSMFQYVVAADHILRVEKAKLESERKTLIKEMVRLLSHLTADESALHEKKMLDCIRPLLNPSDHLSQDASIGVASAAAAASASGSGSALLDGAFSLFSDGMRDRKEKVECNENYAIS